MSVLFNHKVFGSALSGTTAVTTPAELNGVLSQAEKFFVFARTAAVSGTNPTLTVKLQHSNDNENWSDKSTLINAAALKAGQVEASFGSDAGSTVGGAFMRLQISLGGTSPQASIEIYLCGRSDV